MKLSEKLYEALFCALMDERFIVSEFDFRGDSKYFEIEFCCYGIYRSRFEQLLNKVGAIFKSTIKSKVYVSAEKSAHNDDLAFFLVSTDKAIASYTHKAF